MKLNKCKICGKYIPYKKDHYQRITTCSVKCRRKSQGITIRGDGNPNWRGEKAKYQARHKWLYSCYGSINFCQHCYKKGNGWYDWANISGKYKRDISDWVRLCRSCHVKFDM